MAQLAKTPLQKSLIGPAGEHYCLAQLLRRGQLATAAPPGVPDIDLLVLSVDGNLTRATIQVKTRTVGRDGGWHMRKKHEALTHERMFYAFVDFEPAVPSVYVIPALVVADVIGRAHAIWLAMPGKNGHVRQDHAMRRIMPDYGFKMDIAPAGWMMQYRDAWHLISAAVGPGDPSVSEG